jgi:putative ABC transport system substrate-binding protein
VKRREFISLIGSAASSPFGAIAQQQPIIGFLSSRSPAESSEVVAGFRKGLRQLGFVEGQNAIIAFRWAEGDYGRLSVMASELVGLRVAVLVAVGGSPSAIAAKRVTSTIPVIFLSGDAVRLGLVSSLNRPGGNVTGVSNLSGELGGKSVGILKQLTPAADAVGYLLNPSNPISQEYSKDAQAAATSLGVRIHFLNATTLRELDDAFATLGRLRVGLLGVMADSFFDTQRERVVGLSAQYKIAGCYPWREYVLAGGLLSYGTNLPDSYRQVGIYTGRILKGENPADLPVMQPTKFELVLNLKTAKVLGLDVAPTLLSTADEVIE